MVAVGSEEYIYEVAAPDWAKLPLKYIFTTVPGLAVDSEDRLYVFNRHPNHLFILDRNGNYVTTWNERIFENYALHSPHGFYIGPDEKVYITDVRDHTVRKFTLDGKLLLTLGAEGKPGKEGEPFRRPAGAAISSSGDIFVADGYDNAKIHKFSPEGELLLSWGKPGTAPGEFNLPHGVWVDKDDRVWVADRQNNRLQLFTTEGKYLNQFTDFNLPSTVFIDSEDTVYVPEIAGRMSILNLDGKLLARWGSDKRFLMDFVSKSRGDFIPYREIMSKCLKGPGQFSAAHACWADSRGDLYVGEVESGQRVQKFIRKR